MRKKILAGNWKMHKLNSELESYFHEFNELIAPIKDRDKNIELIFGGSFLHLQTLVNLSKKFGFKAAAQNCHYDPQGAYTGEVSLPMLADIGVPSVIIGHSERRQYYSETDASVALKVKAAVNANFLAIACVGETDSERKNNLTHEVIKRQMLPIMEAASRPENLVIAYEPVWAIGTGVTATTQQAQDAHSFIRGLLTNHYGKDVADKIRILYGGSMKPENVAELLSQPDIDGGLVGGASLKAKDFAQMVLKICS